MMAASKKMLEQEPSEIEMLLPWHAAGTLNARDARRVDEALARDPELAKQYAVIREEYAETIDLNESLGAPSARAMQKLFAAIDAEPAGKPSLSRGISTRISGFFASLSPRTLAWSASIGALALLLQAGVIGAVLMKNQPASFQTASLSINEPITRIVGAGSAAARAGAVRAGRARRRHHGAARQLSGLDRRYAAAGMFRLQFGSKAMSKDEIAGLMSRLQEREDRQSRGGYAVRRTAHRGRATHKARGLHDPTMAPDWRIIADGAAVLALIAAAWLFASFDSAAVQAQSIMRSPSLNIAPRLPRINPSLAARRNPTITGRTVAISRTTPVRSVPRIGVGSTLPYVRYSPNIVSALQRRHRDGGMLGSVRLVVRWRRRRCVDQERQQRPAPRRFAGRSQPAHCRQRTRGRDRRRAVATRRPMNWRGVTACAAAIAEFPADRRTVGLFRITDRRSVDTASREFATEASVRSVQPNFRYVLQEQKERP